MSDLRNYDGLDGGERNVGCWRGRTDRRVQAGTLSVASEAKIDSNREEREMSTGQFGGPAPRIVSREEWLAARLELLAREKELTAMKDRLAAERRRLPWVRVEQDYVFD